MAARLSNSPSLVRAATTDKLVLFARQSLPVSTRPIHLVVRGAKSAGNYHSRTVLAMRLQLSYFLGILPGGRIIAGPAEKGIQGFPGLCVRTCTQHASRCEESYQSKIRATMIPSVVTSASSGGSSRRPWHALSLKLPNKHVPQPLILRSNHFPRQKT